MDPAVRKAATDERRLLQSLYEAEGTVGEGAFGVVLKALVKAHPHSLSRGDADAAEEGSDANGATSSAAASSAAAAAAASAAAVPAAAPTYVAIKKMLNHREGQGIPQDAYREIKVRHRQGHQRTK